MSSYQATNLKLVDVILEALAHFVPKRATANAGSSGALANAYGVAISTTMIITTGMLFLAMRWRWRLPLVNRCRKSRNRSKRGRLKTAFNC